MGLTELNKTEERVTSLKQVNWNHPISSKEKILKKKLSMTYWTVLRSPQKRGQARKTKELIAENLLIR